MTSGSQQPARQDEFAVPVGPAGGLSIRVRLFLVIGTLLALVTAALSVAAYREMRASAIATTFTRLDGIATQWARLFEASTARQLAVLRAARDNRIIHEALDHSTAAADSAAMPILRPLLSAELASVVRLLNAEGKEIAHVGDDPIALGATVSRETLDRTPAVDSGTVAPLRAAGPAILATIIIRVRDGAVQGYLTQTTRVHVSPSPETLNRLFGGEATQMRFANRDGTLWTDLSKPIPAPAVDSFRTGTLTSYTSPMTGRPVFAVSRLGRGTPYMVVLETAVRAAVGQAPRFLVPILGEGALIIVLGLLVAIWLSDSVTRPIARLTRAVESGAAGDYSLQVGLAPRGDELGRLSSAFNTMVAQVQTAFASTRAAEEKHRLRFEAVPLPLWVYDLETLRIVAVNDAALHHYGYDRDELLAMTVADIRPAEDVQRLREAIRDVSGANYGGGEWRHRKKDGTLIDIETNALSIEFQGRPARIVLIHDITERKRGKEGMRRQEEGYRRLVDDSPDGVTLSALDGRFLAVNPAFARMLGYDSIEEVRALAVHALFPKPASRHT